MKIVLEHSDRRVTIAADYLLTGALSLAIVFLVTNFAHATTPNPGHPWTDIGNGTWQVNNTQTSTRTFTFPDADATVLTNLAASTTQLSVFNKSYFGATATSTFDSAGVLTLASPLALTSGGTNASLSASNGGIVWSNASQFQVLSGTATAGQILRSGASATPSWSTATYPATSGTAGQVLMSDGTNWISTQVRRINQSTAAQNTGFASDTYVTGSSITIPTPSTQLQVGTRYHALVAVHKTGAGTAVPTFIVRYGTAGGTGDTSLCSPTLSAGTAAVDDGLFEVRAVFRVVGASAVLQCDYIISHSLSTTGLISSGAIKIASTTSATFNSAAASNEIIGVSLNGGASAVWSVADVQAELDNLAS